MNKKGKKKDNKSMIKIDKNKIIFMTVCMVVLVLSVALKQWSFTRDNSCKYQVHYDDEGNPNTTFDMCISKDKDIIVTVTDGRIDDGKEGKITIHHVELKEENQKYIDTFIERYLGKKKKVSLKLSDIARWSREDQVIFQALVYDDEGFLETLKQN